MRSLMLALAAILLVHVLPAQKLKKIDKAIIANLQQHITYLADDKLEGRRAGTKGEQLAMQYISSQFQSIGLQPKGDNNSFLQSFPIYEGRDYDKKSFLFINGHEVKPTQFFPFPNSPKTMLEAMPSIALRETGVPWFIDLKEVLESNAGNPHADLAGFIRNSAKEAAQKGANALFLYNTSTTADALHYNAKGNGDTLPLPVIYVTADIAKKYFTDETETLDIKLKVEFTSRERNGHNVIGFLDNGAAHTVLIGAHFDHLGYGEDNNAADTAKLVYNGADDNASGTAALIELAKMLKTSKVKTNNYLFIAFSGEELGLFGSKYFTEHPSVGLATVNYMINMDMIGRLNDSSKKLTVGGFGTSPTWAHVFAKLPGKDVFKVLFDSSGMGPSDHASFYRKEIPVLFFFTGLHADYHKPTDDFDKINYTGTYRIVQYIYKVIETTSKEPRLAFAKTRESQMSSNARFNVTLGIMPDYSFGGQGVKADGVSDGRPAQKAGLKAGDVIVQLGDYPVSDMETYMQALSKFKKGDKTTVKYTRGLHSFAADVVF